MDGETVGKVISTVGTCIGALCGLAGFICTATAKAKKAADETEMIRQAVKDELIRLQNNG